MKFKSKSNDRIRFAMQSDFAYGIITAARDWMHAGRPESEWSELYEFVIAEANRA
jgi:hypothetical protein